MRRDKDIRDVALQIGIALSAGMFSIMPSVSASPVLDHVVSGGAVVDQKTTPNVTDVTSTTRNNVIDWKDFSVAQGETVRFDEGAKINNYLNVVSGPNISQIDGTIQGGKDVYIVNPNGVIFGNTASVDVGSLYVSTRPINEADYNNIDKTTGDMRPLADTASKTGGDIVNMGTVQANSVFVEGSNIKFMDVDEVRTSDGTAVNDNVTIQTMGAIRLGQDANKVLTSVRSKKAGSNYLFTQNDDTTDFTSISDLPGLKKIEDNLAGNYELRNNITIKSTDTFTPIGSTAPFTGKFDGNFYTVSGITVTSGTYGGLFAHTQGATISNVGVSGVNIKALYAGGIVGLAEAGVDADNNPKNTVLTNVFNQSGSISGTGSNYDEFAVGGIVGKGNGIEIDKAYNNATVIDPGAGILGYGTGQVVISNAYDTGNAKYAIISMTIADEIETGSGISNVFTTGSNAISFIDANGVAISSINLSNATDSQKQSLSFYKNKGMDISASGSDDTVWRIYEGHSTPLLRDILRRGNGAVTVNATYTHGDESVVNGGKDIGLGDGQIKMTYNGSVVTSTKDDATFTWNKTEKGQYHEFDADKVKVAAGNKNVALQSIFYCDDQFGYDLVGGNVEMAKRELNIDGQTLNYTHVYNGSADVTEELQGKIESGSAVGGIVAEDVNDLELTLTNFKATFVDAEGKADANASDAYKDIKLEGTITLTKKDGASSSAMDNYAFSGDTDKDGSVTFGENSTAKGKIGRRTLYLKENTTPITKVYDGDSKVGDDFTINKMYTLDTNDAYYSGDSTANSGLIKYHGENGAQDTFDEVSLTYAENVPKYYDAVNNKDAVNAGTWQVKYTGISLGGNAGSNYVLKDSNNDVVATTRVFERTGTITPKLLDTSAFQVVDSNGNPVGKATKVYNGEVNYDVPDGTKLNVNAVLVERDKNVISFALTTSGAYFADKDGVATANVKAATQVKYKIQASTANAENPLSNYKLSDNDANVLTADAMEYAAAGEITRRNLAFVVKKDGIDKPYDGNGKVIGDDYIQIGGEYLDYADDSLQLVAKDAENVTNPLTAEAAYQAMSAANRAQDVYRVDGVVTDKTINYTIKMDASIAGNYTLNGQNAETPLTIDKIGTESIKGKITPLTITPEFNKITKTYDGSEAINTGDANASTYDWGTQLVDGDTVTLNYLKDKDHAYFTEADGTTEARDVAKAAKVRYTDLSLDNGNYELSANELTGEGEITRRLILKDGFTVNGTEASKVYDGTIYYTLPDGATLTALAEEDGNKGIVTDDQPHLKFKLSDDATKTYFTNAAGTETAKDVDTAEKVAYAVDATTDDGYEYLLGNYKLGTSDADAVNLDDSTTGLHVSGAGHIDRRALTITAEAVQNINKTYDKTDDVKNEGGSDYFTMGNGVKYGSNSKKLVSEEGTNDGTSWNIIATYNDADVYHRDNDPQKEVVNNGKDVTFKVYIAGEAAKNYTLNGQNAETYTSGNRLNLTGAKGTINPATITPVFNKITKNYTGTKAITDGSANASSYELQGKYDGDEVTLNYSTDEAHAYFADSQAGDYTDGVTYTGFSLEGAKSGNYKLASDTAVGDGEIKKIQLNMDDFKFTITGVEKEYDTNALIGDNATITVGDHYVDLGDNNHLNFTYTIAADSAYTSKGTTLSGGEAAAVKDAAAGKDGYVTITITDPDLHDNYEYTFVANRKYDFTGVGTINPKKVYATVNGPVEKTYDAKPTVDPTGDSLVTIEGKLDGTNETSAVYIDSSTDAGDAVNYGIGNKSVKYTVKLDAASAGNYIIYDDASYTTKIADSDKFVTNNNTIKQRDLKLTFNPVTKVYDGYTAYGNSTVVGGGAAYSFDPDSLQGNDELTVADGYTANASYNSANVPEANTVTYDKLTITGNDAGNYRLLDANGEELTADADGKYTTTGVGKISKYTLNSTPTITFNHVNKEYDGTDAVVYSRNEAENDPKKFINVKVTTSNGEEALGFDLVSATYTGGGYVNSDDGKTIRAGGEQNPAKFTIKFSSENYTFSSALTGNNFTQLKDGSYQYSDTYAGATITPRKVYVALKDLPATDTQKPYDGTDRVIQTVTGPNNRVYMLYSSDFLSGDKVDIDWDKISAVYSSENVAYDGAGNVTSQDVIYTVGLTGTDAGNYVLYRAADNTAITDANKLTGTGIITPRELTVDFARDEHIFDNSAYLTNPGSNLQLGNLANRDAGFELDSIAKGVIGGRYTDKNVNRADDGTVLDKGLTYNNLQNALADYATRNAIAKNYIMPVDSVTYSVADAKGVITPLEITDPLKAVWQTDVNKVYDATTNLPTDLPAGTNANNILTLQVNTAYDGVLSLQGGEAGYQYSSAGYVSKNVGDRALTYTLTGVKAAQGNYQLADAVVSAALESPWVSTDTARNANGQVVTGNISARPLTIMAETDSKVYDGGYSVATAPASLIHFSAADQAVINADTDGVSYDVTAVYNKKNVGDQTIAYTLTLNGNTNGNYELNNSTATIAGNTASGTTTGNIAKRKVYVTADNINNINKEYNTTNALPDDFVNADHFRLTPTNTDTGIVAGDADIQLNIRAIQGAYNREHAGLRTINFNHFALEDTSDAADSGRLSNYTLETTSITGSGTIYPKSLTIGINAAPTKEYDTRKALSADYATKDNLALSGVLGSDEVNFQVNSANYSDANAATGKTYSYDVSIDNTDYQLTQGTNMPAITVSNNGQTGVITADDGTITKRKVYVSLADSPEIVKTYDGDTKVEQDVTDKIIVRAGDLLNDGTTLNNNAEVINARYDSKDSGNHTVTYDVKLKGDAAGNYEIHRLSNINDAAADAPYSTLEGTGVINKAKLTLDPASISKTYNGTAVIGDGTNDGDEALTKDKLIFRGVNNESFTLTDEAFAKVIGQYGYGTGDANVSWVGEEVVDKDILYTGLSDALTVMNADERTNAISKNYTIDQTAYFAAAQAKGKIKPITLTQAATANWKLVVREYNGDTDLTEVYDYSGGTKGEQLGINDILTLTVTDSAGKVLTVDYEATANYDDMNVGTRHNLNYHIASVNKKVNDDSGNANYVLDSSVMDALAGRNMNSSEENVYSVITPRTLTVDNIAEMTKVYDGTTDGVANAEDYITLTNYIDKDKDLLGFTAQAVYDNPNAGISEDSDELQEHEVAYRLSLSNPNYQLATDTAAGTGKISRKGLTIVATPVSVNMGEAMPKFTGTVEGLVDKDRDLASSFTFDTLPEVNTSQVTGAQTQHPIYGWYRNSYDDGNLGLNYAYHQNPANATAFTVNYINTDSGNPDLKPTPTNNVYQQLTKDATSGFGENNAAAIQYMDKRGNVIATETIGSGTIATGETVDDLTDQGTNLANIGIVGGDIVNLEGADAASLANIEVEGNSSIVNLEVLPINGDKQSTASSSAAEIVSTDSDSNAAAEIISTDGNQVRSNSSAAIQIVDESGNVLEESDEDKVEKQEKEGEIAIQSADEQNEDEIELTVEGNGVNVA